MGIFQAFIIEKKGQKVKNFLRFFSILFILLSIIYNIVRGLASTISR